MKKMNVVNQQVRMEQSYLGSDINFEQELNNAAKFGNENKIKELFSRDISNVTDLERKLTHAAYVAAYEGKINTLKLLFKKGAPILGKNSDNKSYLFAAVEGLQYEVLIYLCVLHQRNEYINDKNKDGETLLEMAVKKYLNLIDHGKPGKVKENAEHFKILEKIITVLAEKSDSILKACEIVESSNNLHFSKFMLSLSVKKMKTQEEKLKKYEQAIKKSQPSVVDLIAQTLPKAIKDSSSSSDNLYLKDVVLIGELINEFEVVPFSEDGLSETSNVPSQYAPG